MQLFGACVLMVLMYSNVMLFLSMWIYDKIEDAAFGLRVFSLMFEECTFRSED